MRGPGCVPASDRISCHVPAWLPDVAVGVAAISEVEHHAVTVSLGAVAQHL